MQWVQKLIHTIELGAGVKFVRATVTGLVLALLLVGYNWRAFKNLATLEAMDSAQLARNIAEGKGYTTSFIRPFSLFLVRRASEKNLTLQENKASSIQAKVTETHPDLANPPVYPVLLAGLMKIFPSVFELGKSATELKAKGWGHFWTREGAFCWHPADFFIALFNQALLLLLVALVFLFARWLFDAAVARLSAFLLLGTELFWRFSISGLPTIFLMLIYLVLVWCLAWLERAGREPNCENVKPILVAACCGALVGLGTLTRYAFGWLIVPVLLFLILFSVRRWLVLVMAALVAFIALLAPWVARNYRISGAPFGTATFAVLEATPAFPEYKLARSVEPDIGKLDFRPLLWRKLLTNTRQLLQNDLPKLGGSWVTAFFLAGLMVMFRDPTLNRLRWFLLLCLGTLAVIQAGGRTQLSDDSPEVNSENLLVLLAPLILIYGVALFQTLLDQLSLPYRAIRFLIVGVFAGVVCLPMGLVFLPPPSSPVVYPPYYPPAIRQVGSWMKDGELMMSDIPWAVAWYGHCQCAWLTLNATTDPNEPDSRENFYGISDRYKKVRALYLTPQSMDGRFLSEWLHSRGNGWGSFIIQSILRKEVPQGFPLKKAPAPFYADQLFLSDQELWRRQ